MKRFLKRVITPPLLALVGLVLAYEEIQWRLSFVFAWLGKLPVFKQIEQWVRGLPPYGALALIGAPTLVITPIKFLAVYWIAKGHPISGLAAIVGAKAAGTAFVARMFLLTKPQLLSIAWVKWAYEKVMWVRELAYDVWRKSPMVRWLRPRWQRRKTMLELRFAAIRQKFSRQVVRGES